MLVKYGSMRNIRVIIAFLCIYLFVAALVLLTTFLMWLARYYPDSSMQSIVEVKALERDTQSSKSSFRISIIENGDTALSVALTRLSDKVGVQNEVANVQSEAIFVNCIRITLSEKLVPLGYFSMLRPSDVRVAGRDETIELSKTDWLDTFWLFVLKKWITQSAESVTIVAKEQAKTYTVINTSTGVKLYEN